MSYSPAGRWVSERLSSATPSETDPASPKPGYGKTSARFTAPLGMPQNYDDEDYEDYEHRERAPTGYHGGIYREFSIKIGEEILRCFH